MAHQHVQKKLSDDPVVRGHETSDADARSVFISGLGLSVGLMVFGFLFSWVFYFVFKEQSPDAGAPVHTFVTPDSSSMPPTPRLQADAAVNLTPFVQEQESVLVRYAWVNEDSGIARIPIERAMELLVIQGLPVNESMPSQTNRIAVVRK